MAHRPFTRRQQRQNGLFLEALRRTGNVRLACRELGVHRACYTKRRARCAAFAAHWDQALAAAHAALDRAGGPRLPEAARGIGTGACPRASLRTAGGEPHVVRQGNGRLQLRLAPPGRMTRAAEGRILAMVEETNNLRLAAAEAGFASPTVLARARLDPRLARALAIARRIGADRLLWELTDPARIDAREFAVLPIPPMTVEDVLFRLAFHRPDGRFQRYRWRRRARPVPFERLRPRIVAKLNAWRRAQWHAETGSWRYPEESEE